VSGKLINATTDLVIDSINTDSRSLTAGQLFIALKGPNFDAHHFIPQVIAQGCKAVIVEHCQTQNIAQIVVDDTRLALGKLAAYVKKQLAPKTVGITGSSGKTTVKEMTAAILSRLGNVLATEGNFNNDIGVPLTLLRLTKAHDFAVIEMGANHLGEIAYTTNLVKPDVAIINNIAAAHLEGFGDLCGVARAKGEIFEGLSKQGVALYNQDTPYAEKWLWRVNDKKVRRFSCLKPADCYSKNVQLNANGCATFELITYQGNVDIELTVPGRHNVCNAVAAAAIALEFDASLSDIRLGLKAMAPVKGRLNLYQLGQQCRLIDDTYNANVESVKAAIELLASYPGRQVLILGDMGELGSDARRYHQEIGQYAYQQGISDVYTLGVLSQSTSDAFALQHKTLTNIERVNAQHFSARESLVNYLQQQLKNEENIISILVKGSRSAHMENVVEQIKVAFNTTQTNPQEQH
jgi:UDP-N-acetylmuramoyl-tripeptide--D-alanyl-D-alanine ligase